MAWTPNVPLPDQRSKGSPALAELSSALHLVHQGESSNDLWHSWYDGAHWTTPDARIEGQQSKAPPALAAYGGRLHLVHLGDSSNQLWHSTYDGQRWSMNVEIEDEKAHSPVAMAEFAGQLHQVHNGDSSNRLYHLVFDGQRWTQLMRIPDQLSKGAPALAVFQGLLHLVHQGDSSDHLWHSTFDGSAWTDNDEIPDQLSKSPPALAVANGLLQLVHLGDSSNAIWHSTFDGASWAPNIAIPHQLSADAPGLAAYGSRLHMVHTGDSEETLWHSSSDGVLVSRPNRRVVVLDLDGVRWDSFYRHLKQVRDAGASTEVTYQFQLPQGASDDTVLGGGDVSLHSALAELCFGGDNGMVDVRLPLSSYPTFTFPTHASMYTGTWPGRHGICGHKFVVRDAPPEWDLHQWDALPRALSLQGFCTDEEGSWGAFWDYVWGGFDQVSEDACRNRNRGLNSDLRMDTMFHRIEDAGKRSTVVHAFYHGARRPWEHYGKDQWWHFDAAELRSIKDICSDEDLDQLEVADHGAFAKAELAIRFMPSTVRAIPPDPLLGTSVGRAFGRRDGGPVSGWRVEGEPHPDGAPDLIAIYAASVDEASHKAGLRQQATYLAWFDHRLARFVRELRAVDPETFENTVFAFVADHGHQAITNPPSVPGLSSDNVLLVREELMNIRFGEEETARLRQAIEAVHLSVSSVFADVLDDEARAWAEAMNLYVYLRDPATFDTVTVATRLLTMPMNTEPYGALVLIGDQYRFLARGETRPVPLDSPAARRVIVPRLDPPAVSTAEIEAVSLTGADASAERVLREALNTAQVFDLLGVTRRVAGFEPETHRSMPDIVLLAPEGRSFTSSPSTHGSFAYPTTRIPLVFCGPGMPGGRVTLQTADLVDFAPTVLTLLDVPSRGLHGRSLLDRDGRPRRDVAAPVPAPETAPTAPAAPRSPVGRDKRRLPAARVVLRAGRSRRATPEDLGTGLPAYAAVEVVRAPRRPDAPDGPAGRGQPGHRDLTVGGPRWVRLERARVLAAPSTRLWVADASGGPTPAGRRALGGGGRVLDLPERGALVVGANDAVASILVPRELLVVPIRVTLLQVPRWLRELVATLRRHTRTGLDEGPTGTLVLTSADFAAAIAGLSRQLDPESSSPGSEPVPSPTVAGSAAVEEHRVVTASAAVLRRLLVAREVTRFSLAERGLLG